MNRQTAQAAQFECKRYRVANLGGELHVVEGCREPHEARGRFPTEAHARLVAPHDHRLHAQARPEHLQLGDDEQPLGIVGKRAKPVPQFRT